MGWDVQVKQVGQIRQGSFGDYIKAHGRDFTFNSLSYWKPMHLSQVVTHECVQRS